MSIATFHHKSYAVWPAMKFHQTSTQKCNSYVKGITLRRTTVKCGSSKQTVFVVRHWTKRANALRASVGYVEAEASRKGTAVAQWLRCCATNWKVAGSITDDVTGIFH